VTTGWGEITAQEIIGPITGARVSGKPDLALTGLCTDSRKVESGDIFWALRGERFDGHDFVRDALGLGAAGAVVEGGWWDSNTSLDDPSPKIKDAFVICVDDTLKALGDLAGWWRRRHCAKVVAITGSSGKTTTKEMVAGILKLGNSTLKNRGNFNNLIGLPLTVLRLKEGHEMVVLEMGMNRPGEISRLTEIADPDVGVILNVGQAHLEGLLDVEGVAKAKTELIEKISSGAQVVINGDDDVLMNRASMFHREKITFGLRGKNDVRATNIRDLGGEGIRFDLRYQDRFLPINLGVPGLHNLKNALAAGAVALCLNASFEDIVKGLEGFQGLGGRFRVNALGGGVTLVDDTYNANPSSLGVALDALRSLRCDSGRLIVALGEMMELGEATVTAHREAGRRVAGAGSHYFVAMGEHAREMKGGAVNAGMPKERVGIVETHDEMVKKLEDEMREGDLILIKGSRKMELEKVVEGLRFASYKTNIE